MWLVFANHLGGEGRVVGEPFFCNGLVEAFGCEGSERGGSIENEFSVLFVSDDVRGCSLPGLGEEETPHVCIAVFDSVDDDLGSVCSRG